MKVAYSLPRRLRPNRELENSRWTDQAIRAKTGIESRYVVSEGEYATDLATAAVEQLLLNHNINRTSIDFLLYCTQSPDYLIPTNACMLQHRLSLRKDIGALDYNLGCSAYPYGLAIAKGLILSGQVSNVLLVTAETYSRYIHPDDIANKILFGDGASATLVDPSLANSIIASEFGTDGSGSDALMVPHSGMRGVDRWKGGKCQTENDQGSHSQGEYLFMDGGRIMNFTLRTIPHLIQRLLEKTHLKLDDIDHFVFHQANLFILNKLREKCGIPEGKFHICLGKFGNTVSSSIPIALSELSSQNTFKSGDTIMIIGFGVGLSWSGVVLNWL